MNPNSCTSEKSARGWGRSLWLLPLTQQPLARCSNQAFPENLPFFVGGLNSADRSFDQYTRARPEQMKKMKYGFLLSGEQGFHSYLSGL